MRILMVVVALLAGVLAQAQEPGSSSRPTAPGPLQGDLKARFVGALEQAAAGVDGVVGYVVTDLTSGERVAAHLDGEPFPTASAIKLSILYEMFKQAEAGTLDLDKAAAVNRALLVGGSGVLQYLGTPSLSLRDQATLMIAVSDNSSTNIVIRAVGMERVNTRMAALGLSDIRLRRLMMDAEAVGRGDENVASPASLAKVAELLWRGEGFRPESRTAALGMLRLVTGFIRQAIPSEVPVFSKTGTLDGVRTEAAVVEVKGRPFSLAVMTTYLAREDQGERVIGQMAAESYGYFDRLASGGAYGRK